MQCIFVEFFANKHNKLYIITKLWLLCKVNNHCNIEERLVSDWLAFIATAQTVSLCFYWFTWTTHCLDQTSHLPTEVNKWRMIVSFQMLRWDNGLVSCHAFLCDSLIWKCLYPLQHISRSDCWPVTHPSKVLHQCPLL